MFSDKIQSLLDDRLTSELLKDQFSPNPDEVLTIQKRSELKSVITDLFKLFNLFILSGEYVDNKQTRTIIEIVEAKLNDLISNYESDPESENFILTSFLNPVKSSLNFLKEIEIIIINKISRGNSQVILQGHKSFEVSKSKDIYGIASQLNFLEINYKITKIDHQLTVNNKQLEDLLICIIELEDRYATNGLSKFLVDKCKLLCSKISQRFKDDNKSYLYSFEFQDKEIRSLENEIEIFTDFKEQYKSHYFNVNDRTRKSRINSIYNSIEETGYDLSRFHSLIKNYKDDNKSLLQIENLISEFEKSFSNLREKSSCEYDKRNYSVA